MGAGILASSLESRTLFKYTIEIDTHQYAATICAICTVLDFGLSSPSSIVNGNTSAAKKKWSHNVKTTNKNFLPQLRRYPLQVVTNTKPTDPL